MQNETLAASAVKVAAVNTGAAISMIHDSGAVSTVAGVLAATYSAIQIIKSLPWIIAYGSALYAGCRGNWKPWRVITKRAEQSDGNDA